MQAAAYPENTSARRRWIEQHRGPRHAVDPSKPHAFFVEPECSESGAVVPVATIFLTNRECPWRCVMCDLWKNTLEETVPPGAIPTQIDYALENLGLFPGQRHVSQLKLYNSGSFFDRGAVPISDHASIAKRVSPFRRVILECHPSLVSDEVLRFRDSIGTELEIAMGLETANPETLARLNKGMTLDDFARASNFLREHGIAVRAFILLKPPFTSEEEGVMWTQGSIDFAFDQGASVASIIPTRLGNGALDALAQRGDFSPPQLASLEDVLDYGVALQRGRVFADLWDLQQFSRCRDCFDERKQRLSAMNLTQRLRPRVVCSSCER